MISSFFIFFLSFPYPSYLIFVNVDRTMFSCILFGGTIFPNVVWNWFIATEISPSVLTMSVHKQSSKVTLPLCEIPTDAPPNVPSEPTRPLNVIPLIVTLSRRKLASSIAFDSSRPVPNRYPSRPGMDRIIRTWKNPSCNTQLFSTLPSRPHWTKVFGVATNCLLFRAAVKIYKGTHTKEGEGCQTLSKTAHRIR